MEIDTVITIIISVCGFLVTIATLSRKMITKDDLKDLKDALTDLSERNTNLEKKFAIIEYKVEELQKKAGM